FIRHVVEDQQKARSGGRERVHKRLRELRYPVTTQIEERFDRARCLLGFPGGGAVKLTPPPFFEGEKIRVSFEAGSAEELGVFAEKLLDASSLDAAHELFRCLGAPDDEIESPGEGREP
ncbi:MAG: hypothetical protein U9N45_02810, partial [Gemmatimonadota bacterium]|nr:hypothetical protein [Gemmatimonadota bacterium]